MNNENACPMHMCLHILIVCRVHGIACGNENTSVAACFGSRQSTLPMPFIIGDAIRVDAEHLHQPVFIPAKEVGGKFYFNLKKSDRRVERLLANPDKDGNESRCLPRTSIIEDIANLSTKAFWCRVNAYESDVGGQPHDFPRYGKHAKARALMIHDDPAEIEVGPIGDIPAKKLNVLLTRPSSHTLMVELSVDVLMYLRNVVAAQLITGDTYRKRLRKTEDDMFHNEGNKGISKDYSHNRIRVVKCEDGTKKNKYFHIEGDDTDAAMSRAKAFLPGAADDDHAALPNHDGESM